MKWFGLLLIIAVITTGCGDTKKSDAEFTETVYEPVHAVGFEIKATPDPDDSSRLLVTRSAWQGDGAARTSIVVDGTPAERIVAMSSSHVAMLDALGVSDRIVGVSGKGFLSTPSVVTRIDEIADVGYDGNIDYEKLISVRPDIILLYGVNGASSMESKLRELGIPFVYIGDYMEETPLGKAEWLRFLAEIVGKQQLADSLMSEVSQRYADLVSLVSGVDRRPSVMLNMPVGDQWYLPTPGGYMPRMINDAGGRYMFESDDPRTSVPVDFETAYSMLSGADLWLNPGGASDLTSIAVLAPKLAGMPAVADGKVFNNNARLTPGGGNDFWESSAVHPDIVLADLISIIHPELLPDRELYYFRRLQ
ncbi:MAG: ABC transporter substrate-binding protein [Muribaculaceae bacterium]|nr:ABC transporter substrate-binding protein [Muribaculaceae bacterium]